jgi:hypothetical protein
MRSVMSREQNAGHSHNIETGNRPVKSVADFKYLGRTVTNEDCIYEELMSFNSGMLATTRYRYCVFPFLKFCLCFCVEHGLSHKGKNRG